MNVWGTYGDRIPGLVQNLKVDEQESNKRWARRMLTGLFISLLGATNSQAFLTTFINILFLPIKCGRWYAPYRMNNAHRLM